MNPANLTLESVSAALGHRPTFNASAHADLVRRREALKEGAKAVSLRSIHTPDNDVRIDLYTKTRVLAQMAAEIDLKIEAMMKGER